MLTEQLAIRQIPKIQLSDSGKCRPANLLQDVVFAAIGRHHALTRLRRVCSIRPSSFATAPAVWPAFTRLPPVPGIRAWIPASVSSTSLLLPIYRGVIPHLLEDEISGEAQCLARGNPCQPKNLGQKMAARKDRQFERKMTEDREYQGLRRCDSTRHSSLPFIMIFFPSLVSMGTPSFM